jgi:hypothetical protein
VPPGKELVVTASGAGGVGGIALILMLRPAVADCDEGWVESVTLIVADHAPTEFCPGVPAIIPVPLLMDNPLGRFPALYV